jgi:hypothetical protein
MRSRIEIILSRLIDHSQLIVCGGIPVGNHLVDLSRFEGNLVSLVSKAEDDRPSTHGR